MGSLLGDLRLMRTEFLLYASGFFLSRLRRKAIMRSRGFVFRFCYSPSLMKRICVLNARLCGNPLI